MTTNQTEFVYDSEKTIDELIDRRNELCEEMAALMDAQQAARNRAHETERPNWYGSGSNMDEEINRLEAEIKDLDEWNPAVLAEIRRRKAEKTAEINIWNI